MWDLRRLRLLRELQLRGTITAVAASLNFSASTVSHQLAQLQREVGVPLLVQDGRRVRLTPQGVTLAEHAARVLDLETRTRDELAAMRTGTERVRVAALESVVRALLPRALTLLEQTRPDLRIEVDAVSPEEGLFELEAHRYDLVVAEEYPGHTRPHAEGIEREVLGFDAISLATSAASSATSIADFRDSPWVMESPGTAARNWAEQQCRAAGFEPEVRYVASDLHTHLRLIAAGHAVGLVSELVGAASGGGLRFLDLPGRPHRDIFTATRGALRDRDSVRLVRDALGTAFAELVAGGAATGPGVQD
ncbi:LysR family transcriptional regulator [Pseudoclavibacter sp. VKM Ac-2867]|uniref:LysR family transcriptional regulator n=1 Tax=Pseudoclavibacter sp. VKM Ac-2867 TaxID=2783829 RepID=UPI00188B682F|nr:LysR family transcriptional regulator [Pseudoclavibacter sp. VKM Ac-2867]MBF4457459.1 LysR family transcriptional regulator [Pseudoclavibacter sp. VKM Ac-2867]